MGSFLTTSGIYYTGEMVRFPVGKGWFGRKKYATFQLGKITRDSVVLMSDTYGEVEVSRAEAVLNVATPSRRTE